MSVRTKSEWFCGQWHFPAGIVFKFWRKVEKTKVNIRSNVTKLRFSRKRLEALYHAQLLSIVLRFRYLHPLKSTTETERDTVDFWRHNKSAIELTGLAECWHSGPHDLYRTHISRLDRAIAKVRLSPQWAWMTRLGLVNTFSSSTPTQASIVCPWKVLGAR